MAPTSKSKAFATETKLVQDLAAIFDDSELTELELETEQADFYPAFAWPASPANDQHATG